MQTMKVLKKQRNSKMCIMCGLDNEYGVKAPFYSMEDGSVITLFSYREQHQSYPGRVHGGLITAMLDEMGLRALWALELDEKTFGVTMSLETKYRKPVPYGVELLGQGKIIKDTGNFLTADARILDHKIHKTRSAKNTKRRPDARGNVLSYRGRRYGNRFLRA